MNKKDIFEIVTNNICEVLPELIGYDFKETDELIDLGANSIDRSEIINLTLEKLELPIPRTELSVAQNIGELVEVIYGKICF